MIKFGASGCRAAKFNLEDGSWILMRQSGAERLVRVYAEASNEQELEVLLESGREYILGR
jgi:phosphoglucomutase